MAASKDENLQKRKDPYAEMKALRRLMLAQAHEENAKKATLAAKKELQKAKANVVMTEKAEDQRKKA